MIFATVCDGCGARIAGACERCRRALLDRLEPRAEAVITAVEYEGLARELILGLKYRHHRVTADALAEVLVAAIVALGGCDVDVVTWVPTTAARRRARGVDHAESIARRVARRLGVRSLDVLHKIGDSRQTGASRQRRLTGVVVATHRRVDGSRLLLVDDVVTTGASMRACRNALVESGARGVVCAAVARTPGLGARR